MERGGVRFGVGTGTSFVQTEGHFNQNVMDRISSVMGQLPVELTQYEHISIPSMGGSFEASGLTKQVLGKVRGFSEGAEERQRSFIAAAADRAKKTKAIKQTMDLSENVMKSGEGNDNSTMLKRGLRSRLGSKKTSSVL
jgi:hypothetical protein